MKKTLIIIAISLLCIGTKSSCKKDDTPAPLQKIYLTKQTYRDVVENYYYDAQNRFSRMEYIDPTFTQTTTVTAYDVNNNPTEYTIKTTGASRASKYTTIYDAQKRPLTTEYRDSTSPTSIILRDTYTFTYTGNKQTRSAFNHITNSTTINEYTFNSDGNFIDQKFTNQFGVHTSSTNWSGYDNKNSPEQLLPHILRAGRLASKNNQTIENYTNVTTGTVTTYTATHLYNNDNYVTQTTYSGVTTPLVYNYTYEKR